MNNKIMIAVLVVIIAAGGIGIGSKVIKNHKSADDATTQTTEAPTEAPSQEQVDLETEIDLTVNLNDYTADKKFAGVSMELLDNSLPNRAKERTSAAKKAGLTDHAISDAVSFPFDNQSDGDAAYSEVQLEILRNPVYGDMVAQALRPLKVGDDKTVGELNPWLVDFINTTSEAMKKKKSPRGIEIWMTYKEGDFETIYVTEEYRRNAVMLCILLDRLDNYGFENKIESKKNWHLEWIADAALTRTTEADYQENLKALVLRYVNKAGKTEVIIGFNALDRRVEILKEPEPEKKRVPSDPVPEKKKDRPDPGTTEDKPDPGTTEDKPGPTTTEDKPDPTTTEDPTPTTTEETPPPTTTEEKPKKDPSQDPVNNGNADEGGGKNDDKGPGEYQPEKPAKVDHKNVTVTPKATEKPASTNNKPASTQAPAKVDNGKEPAKDPIPVQQDSHDTPSNNAGNNNGSFTMPD